MGFGQERQYLNVPVKLNIPQIDLRTFHQTEIVDIEKEIKESQKRHFEDLFRCRGIGTVIYIDGVKVRNLKEERIKEPLNDYPGTGLPSNYGGCFAQLNISQEIGWDEMTLKRR